MDKIGESKPASVFDVAAYILKHYDSKAKIKKPITCPKLQKLVYYSQAWSLAWGEGPIFCETIEAWVHGPIVESLFSFNRGVYTPKDIPPSMGNADVFTEEQRESLDLIIKHYGSIDPEGLTALVHQEPPWKKARRRADLPAEERGSEEILHSDMMEYYSSIGKE